MTFVTVGSERSQMESLTRLLLSAFPGSVIYQQTNLLRMSKDIQETNVDAVFLQASEMGGPELRRVLRRWKPELPVFFLVEQEDFPCFAAEGDVCCLTHPITEGKLRDALFRYGRRARRTQRRL